MAIKNDNIEEIGISKIKELFTDFVVNNKQYEVTHHLSENDKTEAFDGKIILKNSTTDNKLGNLEFLVQIKATTTKSKSFSFDKKKWQNLLIKTKQQKLPVFLFVVSLKKDCNSINLINIKSIYLNDLMPESSFSTKNLKEINIEKIENTIILKTKIHYFLKLVPRILINIPIALQEKIKEYNYKLDNEFKIVKNILYPNIWMVSIFYSDSQVGLAPIPNGMSMNLINEMPSDNLADPLLSYKQIFWPHTIQKVSDFLDKRLSEDIMFCFEKRTLNKVCIQNFKIFPYTRGLNQEWTIEYILEIFEYLGQNFENAYNIFINNNFSKLKNELKLQYQNILYPSIHQNALYDTTHMINGSYVYIKTKNNNEKTIVTSDNKYKITDDGTVSAKSIDFACSSNILLDCIYHTLYKKLQNLNFINKDNHLKYPLSGISFE